MTNEYPSRHRHPYDYSSSLWRLSSTRHQPSHLLRQGGGHDLQTTGRYEEEYPSPFESFDNSIILSHPQHHTMSGITISTDEEDEDDDNAPTRAENDTQAFDDVAEKDVPDDEESLVCVLIPSRSSDGMDVGCEILDVR